LESAIALAEYLHSEPTMQAAFRSLRGPAPHRRSCGCKARRAIDGWFEQVERYLHLDPVQFNYSLLTRSKRISHETCVPATRPGSKARMWFEDRRRGRSQSIRARMSPRSTCVNLRLRTVVVSPMAQYG